MSVNVEKLEDYFFERFPGKLDVHSQLSLIFLLLGEKPGANIMFVDESRQDLVESFCGDFDLEYMSFETELHRKFYITLDEQYFRLLEKVEEGSPYHTRESEERFLGYPENSGSGDLGRKLDEKVDGMIEDGKLSEENSYLLDLALFTPELTGEGIRQAVEIGERRRELLRQFDRKHDTDFGERILNKVFGRPEPYFRTP